MGYGLLFLTLLGVVQALQANHLGRPFSILHGLKPSLPVQGDFSSVFYPVKKVKLFKNIQHQTVQSNNLYFSDFVQLTYHPDDKDLIKTFFSIWQFEDETRDAGPFTNQPSYGNTPTTTKQTYATLLGISPENMVGKSYVLARYWKTLNTTTVTSADFADLTKPALFDKSTSDQIAKLFAEYGTHYVSGYEMGDMIYQVFVYDKHKIQDILRFPFSDPNYNFGTRSYLFRQFTQPMHLGTTGFCRQAGRILSASGDSALDSIKPKLRDNVYMIKESIFMFPLIPNEYDLMNKLVTTIPIKLFFKPIINTLLPADLNSRSRWNDVLSATVFQKFGAASLPNFPRVKGILDQVELYGSFNPELVTSTATNYDTITRMTFRLDDFTVLDPKYVTHLFIFADVLEISQTAKMSLPGSQKIYLVCRKFVALSSGNNVPEMIVGSYGKSDPLFKIIAKEFRGILKVSQVNEGTHQTYANELVYKSVRDPDLQDLFTVKTDNSKRLFYPNRQSVPELYDAADKSHEGNWLRGSLTNGFGLAVASVETILAAHTSNKAFNTASESLEWITETLVNSADNSTYLSADLEMVLGRALLIRKTQLTEYAKSRVIVPKLSFPEYKPLYEELLKTVSTYQNMFRKVTSEINRRKQIETVTNSLKDLNKNVKSIGSFLVEQAEVNAKYQEDIANTRQSIHNLEKDRILREQAQAHQILQEILQLQKNVKTTGDALVAAIKQYQKEQIISSVFSVVQVVGSLFTGGVGLANIDKDLTGIVRVAEKMKNVMSIIEQVAKLYDLGINMRNDIGTINRALENIPSGQIDVDSFPTELEWDDFDTDVYSYTTTGGFLPGQVAGEALDFQRAAKRLSSRGRKYISIAANIANIQYKQIQIEMERDLAKRQKDRLRQLKAKLTQDDLSDNDAKTTDLFELGNIIKMKENQVRSQLVQTFVVMDAALQYYYLQKPTLVNRFDTMAIQQAAVNQIQSCISALENFPSLPKDLKEPIKYDIEGVPVKDLLSEDGYKVTIPLSSLPFHDYVRVRILRMEVRADNILKSAGDFAYIQSTASGELFQDRDLNRNPRSYSTFPTEFRTVYNIKTGQTKGNPSEEFVKRFIKITPFDDWVFRMPKVTTNKGLKFKTVLTTLRVKFYLRVIYHPSKIVKRHGLFNTVYSDDVSGSKNKLLGDMSGRSLVREWDAIMAVNAKRVNEIWKKQYDDQTKAGFVKRIVTERKLSYRSRSLKVEARIILKVGPPIVQFLIHNQDRATLNIKILEGSKVEYWETMLRSGYVDNFNETLTVDEDTSITGTMNLLKLRGSVTKDSRVVLDLSNGVFDVLNLGLSEHVKLSVRNEIQLFFNTKLKSKDFELAEVTYEHRLTPPSLVPDKFYLATGGFGKANSDKFGTLFIFFRTHSPGATAHEQTKRDFNDPLSIDKQIIPTGYEVALFINNRIIFKDIIAKEIEEKFQFGVHTKVLPGQSTSASQQSLYVVGDSGARRQLHMVLSFQRYKNIQFTFTVPGNTLQSKSINKGNKIQVHWVNSNMAVSVPYPSHRCGHTMCYDVIKHKTVRFTTTFIKTFAPSIDSQQTITYKEEGSGSASSSALSGWDSFWLGSEVKSAKNTITSNVNRYMSGLSFNFRSISTFAITQVLFPGSNVFHLTEVYVPGDMVIIGTVNLSGS